MQADALDSFTGWFPLLGNTSWDQGFPSSHTAAAAGLAIALACLYPRGRWLFPSVAVLAGMQRVLSESHFASDVFWGAAVGCIFAPLCVYGGRISKAFDRLERNWLARRPRTAQPPAPHMPADGAAGHSAAAASSDVELRRLAVREFPPVASTGGALACWPNSLTQTGSTARKTGG